MPTTFARASTSAPPELPGSNVSVRGGALYLQVEKAGRMWGNECSFSNTTQTVLAPAAGAMGGSISSIGFVAARVCAGAGSGSFHVAALGRPKSGQGVGRRVDG